MRSPDEFDSFYAASRRRLLLQAYALTGDLPAARSAVRDAYVEAWHHWRKVGRLADPEAWVRPVAWGHAQRRHTARIWHRDSSLPDEHRATLAALGKLSSEQRRVLLLNHLTSSPMASIAREVGITEKSCERTLQSATASFSASRDVVPAAIGAVISRLGALLEDTQQPRSSIIRRAGAARRRTVALAGAAAAAVALVGSGLFVSGGSDVAADLADEQVLGSTPTPRSRPEPPALAREQLLMASQAVRLAPRDVWTAGPPTELAEAKGLPTRCQTSRFIDERGLGSLTRTYRGVPARPGRPEVPRRKAEPDVTATQTTELSRTPAAAGRAFERAVRWYADCAAPSTTLLSTHEVEGVGDEARLFVFLSWGRDAGTMTLGIARTGQIVTSTVQERTAVATPDTEAPALMLAAAVNRLCGKPGAGTCAGPPTVTEIDPLPLGGQPGLLDVVDLPQPGTQTTPWSGTRASAGSSNLATLPCDTSDFGSEPVTDGSTRTFLMLRGDLPEQFGITQTAGHLPNVRSAKRFIESIRGRMAACEDKHVGSSVTAVSDRSRGAVETAVWRVETEISDDASIRVMVVAVRRGTAVSTLGFVDAAQASYSDAATLFLAERAATRLAYLRSPEDAPSGESDSSAGPSSSPSNSLSGSPSGAPSGNASPSTEPSDTNS